MGIAVAQVPFPEMYSMITRFSKYIRHRRQFFAHRGATLIHHRSTIIFGITPGHQLTTGGGAHGDQSR